MTNQDGTTDTTDRVQASSNVCAMPFGTQKGSTSAWFHWRSPPWLSVVVQTAAGRRK